MQRNVGIFAALVIVLGGIWIVYAGRPVMKLNQQPATAPSSDTAVATTLAPGTTSTSPVATSTNPSITPIAGTPTPSPTKENSHTFTMADVAQHATESDCWTVVNGSVYDLTSWVSRHPGGARPIINMCGKDGSSAFERKHGDSPRPQAALALLKIGMLR